MCEALEIFVPVRQVDNLVQCRAQAFELRRPALCRYVAGIEVLAPKYVVDVLEAGPAKRQANGGAQHLIGAGIEKGILRRWRSSVRLNGASTKCLDLAAPCLPMDRHQGQDEIRLVERDALRIGAHEDVGDLLFVRASVEFDDLKCEVAQVPHAVEPFLETVLFVVAQLLAA